MLYRTTEELRSSVQARLARSVAEDRFNEWVRLTENIIKNGKPAVADRSIGTPALRVKEMESGRVVLSSTGSIDMGHPAYEYPSDAIDVRSITCNVGGSTVVQNIEVLDERTFFSSRADTGHNFFYTVTIISINDEEPKRYIVVNRPFITTININYYKDFTSIIEETNLSNHPIFFKYGEIYLYGCLLYAHQEFRNEKGYADNLASYDSVVKGFNATDYKLRTEGARRRVTVAGSQSSGRRMW